MTESNLVRKIFHPNRISAYGGLSSVAGVALLTNTSTMPYGAALVVAGYACDYIDGKIARNYDMKTLEGAKLDPLLDKVRNVFVGGYVSINEIIRGGFLLPVTMAGNFLVDYISQKDRGDIIEQVEDSCKAVLNIESCHKDAEINSKIRANGFGKAKATIQTGVNLIYIGAELIKEHTGNIDFDYISPFLSGALIVSAGLGIKGILERRKS
jgi:hypothetical protein